MKIQHFVNISDRNGTKPLHLCARGGLLNIMEILLRHGADVNARRILSGRGYSALHLAAAGGDLKMCRMLLNYEAELDIRDYDGCTPLHRYTSCPCILQGVVSLSIPSFLIIDTTYTGADHSRLYHKSRLFTQSTLSLNQYTGHVLTETLVTWEVITLLKPISTQNDFPQKESFCWPTQIFRRKKSLKLNFSQ
jgi:hypothetical protein